MPLSGPQPPRVTHRDEALPEEELEARKAGVRTLSKERWEALQIENVEYPDILIRRIAMSSAPSDNAPVAPDGRSMAMGQPKLNFDGPTAPRATATAAVPDSCSSISAFISAA